MSNTVVLPTWKPEQLCLYNKLDMVDYQLKDAKESGDNLFRFILKIKITFMYKVIIGTSFKSSLTFKH